MGGRRQKRSATKLQPGQTVELDYRPTGTKTPQKLSPDTLLASRPGWLAINKPAGLPSPTLCRIPGVPDLIPKSLVAASHVPGEAAPNELVRSTGSTARPLGCFCSRDRPPRAQLSSAFAERGSKALPLRRRSPPREDRGHAEAPKMSAEWTLLRRSQTVFEPRSKCIPPGRTHQVRLLMASWEARLSVTSSTVTRSLGGRKDGSPLPRNSWDDTVLEAPCRRLGGALEPSRPLPRCYRRTSSRKQLIHVLRPKAPVGEAC